MTAAQGRCAGCLETGPVRAVAWHVVQCAAWAALYRKDPVLALDPAAEYARWAAQDRAREHAADLAGRVDDTVRRREESAARFRRRDLLGE